jgi:hypothetical protein
MVQAEQQAHSLQSLLLVMMMVLLSSSSSFFFGDSPSRRHIFCRLDTEGRRRYFAGTHSNPGSDTFQINRARLDDCWRANFTPFEILKRKK